MNDILKKYCERTGQTFKEVMSGATFFGIDKVLELVTEAESQNKVLAFYYENEEALIKDILSYRFE